MRTATYVAVRIILAIAVSVAALMGICGSQNKVYGAQQGTWVATAVPHYAHPVTGAIEDTGSDATLGQAMCKSMLYPSALIEVDSNNTVWATVRLNLMDKIESATFKVQKGSRSAFKATKATITKENMDKNQSDFRMKIPSTNAILRVTFFVKPMGRDVVSYITFKNLKAGHSDFVTSIKAAKKAAAEKAEPPASEANSKLDVNSTSGANTTTSDQNIVAPKGGAVATAQTEGFASSGNSASTLIQQAVGLTGKDGLPSLVQQVELHTSSTVNMQWLVLYILFSTVILIAFAVTGGYYLYVRGVRVGRRMARRAQMEGDND